MEYRKKLVKFYGGESKAFKYFKWVEKRLKEMAEEEIITTSECLMRTRIMQKWKRALQLYV